MMLLRSDSLHPKTVGEIKGREHVSMSFSDRLFFTPDKHSESGVAMIELTIVIGFVLFLMLGTFEYGGALQTKQLISQLSREAANLAFRDCAPRPVNDLDQADAMQACLDRVLFEVESIRDGLGLANTSIIVAVYLDPTTVPAGINSSFVAPDVVGEFLHTSRFAAADFQAGGRFETLVQQQGAIATGEAFVNYVPRIFDVFFTPGVGSANFTDITINDSTIY